MQSPYIFKIFILFFATLILITRAKNKMKISLETKTINRIQPRSFSRRIKSEEKPFGNSRNNRYRNSSKRYIQSYIDSNIRSNYHGHHYKRNRNRNAYQGTCKSNHRRLKQELSQNHLRSRPKCFSQTDLASAFGNSHKHNIHNTNSANNKRNRRQNGKQNLQSTGNRTHHRHRLIHSRNTKIPPVGIRDIVPLIEKRNQIFFHEIRNSIILNLYNKIRDMLYPQNQLLHRVQGNINLFIHILEKNNSKLFHNTNDLEINTTNPDSLPYRIHIGE